jgi:hypothetical protein
MSEDIFPLRLTSSRHGVYMNEGTNLPFINLIRRNYMDECVVRNTECFKKELHNGISSVAVWRAL